MATSIITLEDLKIFKEELLTEIKILFALHTEVPTRKWLRSTEVRRLLDISPGTLHNLRVNGTLPYSKIHGVLFYDYDDVLRMLTERKASPPFGRKEDEPKTPS